MDYIKPVDYNENRLEVDFRKMGMNRIDKQKKQIEEREKEISGEEKENKDDGEGSYELPVDNFIEHRKSSFVLPSKKLSPRKEQIFSWEILRVSGKSSILSSYRDYQPREVKITPFFMLNLTSYLYEELKLTQATTISGIISYFIYLSFYSAFIRNERFLFPPKPPVFSEKYFKKSLYSTLSAPARYEISPKSLSFPVMKQDFGLL